MKRFLICLLAIFCFLLPVYTKPTFAENETNRYIVTANSASIFETPDFLATKLKQIKHKTEIVVELENGVVKEYQNENFIFYKVLQYENVDGYIFCDLVVPKNESLNAIPNFNASTNNNCKVFLMQDNNLVESEITLNKNDRIFLYQGYDSKKEFNAVAFVFDNQVLYGYLQTKYISPDGINKILIYSIIVIIALLGIIFAWLFMKRKKIKIKKRNIKLEKN